MHDRTGTSLIDLVLSIGIVALIFGGVYLIYFSIVNAVQNVGVRTAATSAITNEIETIRNLPYDSVGTVFGVPSGIIPQNQTTTIGNYIFNLATTIRNIDDPFDGVLGGTPNDTAPNDYKLVSITASCVQCGTGNFIPVTITTTVAPKNLESATQNGSLFLYAVDANGNPVSGVTMSVVNASVTPSINLQDTTNASGVLQLVGVPTSTQGYSIVATKSGYSTDQTYPIGGAGNPNPSKPNATVAAQTVTGLTFAVDKVSMLTVTTENDRCAVTPNGAFTIQGTKLIGTNPNVLKFATSSNTGSTGSKVLQNVEWDTYLLGLTNNNLDVEGTIPLSPLIVNPSSTLTFQFIMELAANPALLVTTVDAASGAPIPGALVTLSGNSTSENLTTDHSFVTDNDWSGHNYVTQSGGIDAESVPNALVLLANASGTYATSTNDFLISNTLDFGSPSTTFNAISWDPQSEPANTSLSFQVAANNDHISWNYIGPDGTSNTFFTSPGPLPASLSGNQYLRYTVYMNTLDPTQTPTLNDISFDFTGPCVPPGQSLFTSLGAGNYDIDVTAPNYAENLSTVSVGSGFQSSTIQLTHL